MVSFSIISRPSLLQAKEHISQVVQRLPQPHGINQGLTGSVFLVEPLEALAFDVEGGYPFFAVLDPDSAKAPTAREKKRPDEDIRGLKAGSHHFAITSFPCFSRGDTLVKKVALRGLHPSSEPAGPSTATGQSHQVDGLLLSCQKSPSKNPSRKMSAQDGKFSWNHKYTYSVF
jgi:hypothetical protein